MFVQRFDALVASFASGVGLQSYDPVVAVEGKPGPALPIASNQDRTISEAALAEARDYAEANRSSILIVWRNGAIEAEHFFGKTMRDELLNSRSFAKPLTAIAIGRAIELGHITSLDQPVADFVPSWRDDHWRSKMLVRHLLDMRTGFLPQAAAFDPQHILNRAYLHPRHDEVIINDYPLVIEPGVRYDYSNATSELIAPVIEAASAMQYEEFIAREILQKIGAAGGEVWINREGGTAHSGCCILLPAHDWLRLSILLLNNGEWEGKRLLDPAFVAEMQQGTPQNPYYGMGVWLAGEYIAERGVANPDRREYTTLHSEPYEASDLYLFDGNANQVSYIVPSEGLVILRMGASPPRGTRWDNAYLPNTIIRGITRDRGSSVKQPVPAD
ncbi:serine hydrolase domain-containing protein [Erythrobacter sp. HA6-11]